MPKATPDIPTGGFSRERTWHARKTEQHKRSFNWSSSSSVSVPKNSDRQYSWNNTTHLNPPRLGPLVEI
jgi:hypothetical protein